MSADHHNKKESDQYAIAAALIRLGNTKINANKRQKLNESYCDTAYSSQYINTHNHSSYMPTDAVSYSTKSNETLYHVADTEIFGESSNFNMHDQQLMQAGRKSLRDEVFANVQYNRTLQMYIGQQNNPDLLYPSSGIYQHTPSFDLMLEANKFTDPLFDDYYKPIQSTPVVQEPVYTQHLAPTENAKPLLQGKKNPLDHSYATASTSYSVKTNVRSVATPDSDRPSTAFTTDSGNSSIAEDAYPLALHDWYVALIDDEFMEKYQSELSSVTYKSELLKQNYMQLRVEELPKDLDYNPNKSRLRKAYDSPGEAAIRLRNNLASRKSRFKKKIAQQVATIQSDFDRSENFRLLAIFAWMNDVIFQLESKWLDHGATYTELRKIRQFCGFPPAYYK